MNRAIANDPELAAHFKVTARDITGDPEDQTDGDEYIILSCKTCPKAWEVLTAADGTIGKGERNAILQHAKAHQAKVRMRRIS